MTRSTRWISATAAIALLAVSLWTATGASATGPKPVTKITFKLAAHQAKLGTAVTSSVLVQTRSGNAWVALPAATLTVKVNDGSAPVTIVTDAAGKAPVSYTTTKVGGWVMKVSYAGDPTHKRAQRAQGFNVMPA